MGTIKTKGELSPDLDIMCSWCYSASKLGEWDNKSYEQCTNREMRRTYTSLTKKSAFSKGSEKFYMCPCCGKWSKGEQLSVVNNDELKDLGGEPVIKM